jgi:hypothetical protein
MLTFFDREVDKATHAYRNGLLLGMWDIEGGTYEPHPDAYTLIATLSPDAVEGYRDAADDSDDMPDPFDPEETLRP